MKKFLIIFLSLALTVPSWATNYYVTQSGTGNGSSVGTPASVAKFNANTMVGTPTGGDTVFFSGGITSLISAASSGSSGNRLTLNFSGVTSWSGSLNLWINLNNKAHLNVLGGGSWTNGVWTQGCSTFANTSSSCISGGGTFSAGGIDDVTVSGFRYLGASNDDSDQAFMTGSPFTNFTFENNYCDNGHLIVLDRNLNHDITIRNNYCRSPALNLTQQYDLIFMGDAYNVTIEGNYLEHRTPGENASGRHNDIIQTYRGGSGNAGNPYGWIIRYNRLVLNVAHNSGPPTTTGDTSWHQIENMKDNGATPAAKVYGNLFEGWASTESNNGETFDGFATGTVYSYHNTWITTGGWPDNTVRYLINGTDKLYARNNVGFDASAPTGTPLAWGFGAGATWDYNWFYNWGATGTYTGTHGGTTDPKFTNTSTKDYSTQSGSPLRNTGDSAIGSEFNQGIAFGAAWPNPALVTRTVGNWDIGAYQVAAAPGDTTAPSITITAPTSSPTFSTSSTPITTIAGTASDDVLLSSITWSNSAGGSGTATGTTTWLIPSISLLSGSNVITVTATDSSANTSTDVITITYTPATGNVTYRRRGSVLTTGF